MNTPNPTEQTYHPLNVAYDFFNKELFSGKLPGCLITMQRKGKARGYFCADRFEKRGEKKYQVHEIALNPTLFRERSDVEILSTLVHEMIHLWQEEKGTAPKRAYHDTEWAEKMEALGLMPSSTGDEEGKRTGHSVSHYIIKGGKFEVAANLFLQDKKDFIPYQDEQGLPEKKKSAKNKIKYTCPQCGINAWGKPGVNLLCGNDTVQLMEVRKD